MENRKGKSGSSDRFLLLGSKIIADSVCSHKIKRHLLLGRKAMTNLDSMLKKQRHDFANNAARSQSHRFSNSHVWMWELDHKEGWAPKIDAFELWCWVLEKTLENLLDCKEVKLVNPKGNQPWIFIGRTDSEAPILWPSHVKSWLVGKDPGARKGWR